jgi:hypothetical protein
VLWLARTDAGESAYKRAASGMAIEMKDPQRTLSIASKSAGRNAQFQMLADASKNHASSCAHQFASPSSVAQPGKQPDGASGGHNFCIVPPLQERDSTQQPNPARSTRTYNTHSWAESRRRLWAGAHSNG